MKTGYLDCPSGISGDMFLGSLIDAGLPAHDLEACLHSLPLGGYRLEITREARHGIFGTRFLVRAEETAGPARNLEAVLGIIERGDLSRAAKDRCMAIFRDLAEVEGKIHDRPAGEVHFHEVGAVDSIIDIVGCVFGLERMGLHSLSASSLPLGSGFTKTAHGMIPIPAPATVALLKEIPVFGSGVAHELVTPTGAALVKHLVSTFGAMPSMVIRKVGYGVGARDLEDRPNLVRILIGDPEPEAGTDTVVVLETNVDDASPEWLGYLMERLFESGALDVVFCPVQMKKNRPGVQVQVIGRPDRKKALIRVLFRETATLGVRFRFSRREVRRRVEQEVDSPWGKLRVKKVMEEDGVSRFVPEYEACRKIALKHGLPLRQVFEWVMSLNRATE